MTDQSKKPTYWFDKDGVLAQYDYAIYEAEAGCTPPWLTKNAHIYRHLPVNINIVDAFRTLYERQYGCRPDQRKENVRILTSVCNGPTLSEHVIDALYWIKEYCTDKFREKDLYAVAVPKQDVPISLFGRISPLDILIDDYNPNLEQWKKEGGIAIKALNGINSRSKTFPNLDLSEPPEILERKIGMLTERITDVLARTEDGFLPDREDILNREFVEKFHKPLL